jgi:hypothetical protein
MLQINIGNQNGRASIIDASGRVVKSVNLSSGINRIQVNELNRGIYMLSFTTASGEISNTRFLKQ